MTTPSPPPNDRVRARPMPPCSAESITQRIREASTALEAVAELAYEHGWTHCRHGRSAPLAVERYRLMAWLVDLRDEERAARDAYGLPSLLLDPEPFHPGA